MPDAACAAKRSIMLPRVPMPFWHIVKFLCSTVYQIQILVFLFSLGGCHRAREGPQLEVATYATVPA